MNLGIDVGYTYTKLWSKELREKFRSTVEFGENDINKSFVIEYEGEKYTIGEKGAYSVDLNKIQDKTFKLCMYTAALKATKYSVDKIDLVTGLPIDYYAKQKESLKKSLEGQSVFLKVKGEKKLITFNKVLVFPQSAGMIIIEPEKFKGDNLVIDIGGMTVDVSYFEGTKLSKYRTYPLGMLKIYGKVIQHLNTEHKAGLDDLLDAEKALQGNLYIENVKDIDLSKILFDHCEEILRPIKLEFPWNTSRKIYIGGGALALKSFLPGGESIREQDIFSNAQAFYRIGCEKFGS
jgi:plasmid segregation protein ParM